MDLLLCNAAIVYDGWTEEDNRNGIASVDALEAYTEGTTHCAHGYP